MTQDIVVGSRLGGGDRVPLQDILAGQRVPTSTPFSDELLEFCAHVSRAISKSAARFAELQALAFWMRKAELLRLRERFVELNTDRCILVPAGSVFHIPPANVDTIFVYSWVLSLLCGNANVVRLSERSTDQTELIIGVLRECLASERYAEVAEHNAMITYAHDPEITRRLSMACDVRVIWGGDHTVNEVRRIALPPASVDVTFPDRVSLAAFASSKVLALPEAPLMELALGFYHDAYGFDQLACSSPRMVIWIGDEAENRAAADVLYARVEGIIAAKGYVTDADTAMRKMSYGYVAAADGSVVHVDRHSNEMTLLWQDEPRELLEEFCGGGAFINAGCRALTDLEEFVTPRFQTLSCFGFDEEQVTALARRLNGRGIDRIVPIGQALTFNRYWDGRDLLQTFTSRVYLEGGAP